jgi:putative FmdB family regulatory protein
VPLYDYQCRACGKVTEVRHGFKEAFEGTCPECSGEMKRLFSAAGIVFKGSGFYITDSRKSSAGDSSSGSKTSSKSEAKSESSSTSETKSESAPSPSSTSETAA